MKFFKVLRTGLILTIVGWAIYTLWPHFKDFSKLWDLRNNFNYWWLLLAVIAQLSQYIGDGWIGQIFLRIIGIEIKIKDTFRIAALNVFAAHLLPIGEAGGMAAAYHFYRKLGVTPEKFIFISICWGILTYVLLFFLFAVPIYFLPNIPIKFNAHIFLICTILIIVGIGIFLVRKGIFRKLQKYLGKYSWFQHFASFIKNRRDYQKLLVNQPVMVLKTIFAGFLYYASNIATLAFSFLTFGTLPSIALITFAYTVSLIFGRVTLAPAGIGATEGTLILVFLSAQIDGNLTLAAVLLYRFISFWLPIPGGAFSYYSLKKEFGGKIVNEDIEKVLHHEDLVKAGLK